MALRMSSTIWLLYKWSKEMVEITSRVLMLIKNRPIVVPTMRNRGSNTPENRNGILLPKLFWPNVRKNCSSDRENLLKFEAEGREFAKKIRSLFRTIYSNSERSEHFLVTEYFCNLFLGPRGFWYLRKNIKNIGI